jgi:hypothetical protein
VTDSEMVEVISVDDHEQALAIIELLKAKGVPDVGFWPKDVLDTSIGILGGGPMPLQPPYRFHAKEPQGPFAVYVPEDLASMTRDYLATPAAQRQIEQRLAADRSSARQRRILYAVGAAVVVVVLALGLLVFHLW